MWKCEKCGKAWYYPVKKCIFCKAAVKEEKPAGLFVESITEVFVASPKHKETPYFVALLKDRQGNFHLRKTRKRLSAGDKISDREESRKFNVGVVGTGIMGSGLAGLLLQQGLNIVLKSRSDSTAKKAVERIGKSLSKGLRPEEVEKLLKNLKATIDFNDLAGCDIVVDCSVEDFEVKKEIFKRLDETCSKETVLASNTSSLSLKELASGLKEPGRVLGLHFFNPISRMALVEVVEADKTSKESLELAVIFSKSIGKEPIIVKDSPCFIVNRMLMPYLNEAVYLLSKGVAAKEDIDKAARLGLNYPIGPLRLLDLIGLDTFLSIMKSLQKQTGDKKFEVPGLVEKMVKENKLGRKTGEGFYKYK